MNDMNGSQWTSLGNCVGKSTLGLLPVEASQIFHDDLENRSFIYHADLELVASGENIVRTSGDVHLHSMPSDPSCVQLMKIVEASGTLDFWNDEAEDIYTESDGDPV